MKQYKIILIFPLLILFFSGCTRYMYWLEDVFHQAKHTHQDSPDPISFYVRCARLYDHFTTVGHFDVLWYADEVRHRYDTLLAEQHCYDSLHSHDQKIRRNNGALTFFILMFSPHIPCDLHLSDRSGWSVCLEINNKVYYPREIKKLKLTHIHRCFFGRHYRHFKKRFEIIFDLDESKIPPNAQMKLCFNTADKSTCVCWEFDNSGHLILEPCPLRDVLLYDLYPDPSTCSSCGSSR